jgi:malic enzyme
METFRVFCGEGRILHWGKFPREFSRRNFHREGKNMISWHDSKTVRN